MRQRFTGKVCEFATCQHCGTLQLPENGLRCRICAAPLITPLRVYRRNWRGEWAPVETLDLTSVLPAPPRRRRKPLSRRWVVLALLAVLPAGVLTWNIKRAHAQEQAASLARQRGPAYPEVKMDATARWATDSRLVISGNTNLPDNTVLEAVIRYSDTEVARSFPIVVQGGSFKSPVLANHGQAFEPGDYEIELVARFAPGEQNSEVFDSVGPRGASLSGTLVAPIPGIPSGKQVAFSKAIALQ